MTQRALLGVFTRAMGLYFAIQVVSYASMWTSGWASPMDIWPHVVIQLAASVGCLVFGDRIASWIYREQEPADRSPPLPSSSPELWRFACYLVGLYALVRSVRAFVASVVHLLQREQPTSDGVPIRIWGGEATLYAVTECIVFAALGIVLIVGPGRVSRWFGRLFGGGRPSGGTEPRDAA